MTIWLDNHLSPMLARWIEEQFAEPCVQIRELGMASAPDPVIFSAARAAGASLMTKDRDFAELVSRLGQPPNIVLLSCGNTSTAYLQSILRDRLSEALKLIRAGEPLVEIGQP